MVSTVNYESKNLKPMKTFKTKLSFLLLAGTLSFYACKKETQVVDPVVNPSVSTPSAAQLTNLFRNYEQSLKQSFVLDSDNPTTIVGSQGTSLNFGANSFVTQAGVPVTGNVNITLIEIFDKGGMILANKPTMGETWGGNIEPIISGGEFFVTAEQNGNQLRLAPFASYQATVPAPAGVDPNMDLFYGDESRGNDTLIWNPADSGRIQGTGNSYFCIFDSLRWINCDYFWNDPNPKTNVSAQLPAGFTNQTCKVFISFNGLNSITSFFHYNAGIYSTAPSYQLPTTLGINLVAISVINNVPHMSVTPATITNNILIPINPLTPTTTAAMLTTINNLP